MAITNHERVGKTYSMRRRGRDTGIKLKPDRDAESKAQSSRSGFHGAVIGEATPLAQVLLGAIAGDEVVLRVPGREPQRFLIKAVKRDLEEVSV